MCVLISILFSLSVQQAQRPTSPTEETTNKEMTEAEREKISSYEDAFEKIKEETGVNSMNVRKITFIYMNAMSKNWMMHFMYRKW